MRKQEGYTLRFILGWLVIGSVLLTAMIGGYWVLRANMKSLSSNYLESNYQYAKKLSSNTTDLLEIMQNNINRMARMASEPSFSQRELELWYQANEHYFNSIFITDAQRRIQAVTPSQTYSLIGSQLTSEASTQAAQLKAPLISEPYVASTGRLILLISAPIFDKDGEYKGMAGGTIYLQEDNVLSRLLGENFHGNGSYVYVVDQHAHLIFHPNARRINEKVGSNKVVQNAIDGGSGSAEIVNSRGESFFAGYAYESRGQWGIISQTPVSVLDKPLEKLALNMALQALPVFAVILLAAWRVSRYISSPLYELARYSEEAVLSKKPMPPELPKIASLIYEVKQLHQSIGNHLSLLNDEIQIDGLTGLANRKTFDRTLQEWLEERVPFALILLDIDFFKQVNDLHGHAAGDEVLRHLASQMRLCTRQEDICFRYGGEEFGILVKHGGLGEAGEEAEKLRRIISSEPGPNGITVTVSLGIAVYMPHERLSPKELVERADSALYQSKVEGRNRVTAFNSLK